MFASKTPAAWAIKCDKCAADPGRSCVALDGSGRLVKSHPERVAAAKAAQASLPPAPLA